MREAALKARAQRGPAWGDPAWGALLAAHVLERCPPAPGQTVAGFWPMPGEIDIRPLLLELHRRGNPVALPVTPPRGQPLAFHRWRPGDSMAAGRFGTMRPIGDPMTPGMLLVPLLAFDASGRRLGYGAGYYDRTLALLPGRRTIGCAFAAQQVAEVPAGPHDVALDAVATERGVIFCTGNG